MMNYPKTVPAPIQTTEGEDGDPEVAFFETEKKPEIALIIILFVKLGDMKYLNLALAA